MRLFTWPYNPKQPLTRS